MKISDLKKFCAVQDIREPLNNIFSIDGFEGLGATNGHIFVWDFELEGSGYFENYPYKQVAKKLIEYIEQAGDVIHGGANNAFEVEIPLFDFEDCSDCKGTGIAEACQECEGIGTIKFENDFNEYEIDCKSCDQDNSHQCGTCAGSGKSNLSIQLKNEMFFDYSLVRKVKDIIPEVKFYSEILEEKGQMYYPNLYGRFDGGVVVIMGLKGSFEDNKVIK